MIRSYAAQTLALVSKCIMQVFFDLELSFTGHFLISENRYRSRTRVYSARGLNCDLFLIFNFGSNRIY